MPVMFELKPCPFCGRDPRMHKDQWKDTSGMKKSYWVRCIHCGSCSEEYRTAEQAAAAWNRRDYHGK